MTQQEHEQQLAEKSDLVLGNIQSNGGLLSPQQSQTFYEILMEQPTILTAARTVQMTAPTMRIPKIGLGTRILRPAVENQALSASDRSKPDFGMVQLDSKEVIAEVRIPYSMLEDNIERGGLEGTILRLIGKAAARDIEEAVIQSDITLDDPYLAMQDGLLKLVQSREVDLSSLGIQAKSFGAAISALPPKYKRNKSALRFYVPYQVDETYRLKVAERVTALGDATLTGDRPNVVLGVPVQPCAMMPDSKGILTDPANIVIGIQRNFMLESFRDIHRRQIDIVLTMRWAMNMETEDAAVHLDGFSPLDGVN
jgi:HK97 family phage major capsid protein